MKFAICGNYGVQNIGDEAILAGLTIAIKKVDKDAEITVLGRGMHMPFGLRSMLRGFKKPTTAIASCDFYILGGGGLFTNEEGIFVPLFWAFQGISALFLKKKLLCLGISIGRLSFFDRIILKHLLRRARLITVRDRASFEVLTSWGITAHETSDFALLLDKPASSLELHEKPYVVISIRPFKNSDEKLNTIIAQFCDSLVSKFGLRIKLLPMQGGEQFDAQVLNKIFDQVGQKRQVEVLIFSDDLTRLGDVLKNAQAVIAMRLHAGILSLISGTPFIPLVYMEKVRDFWLEYKEISPIGINELSLEKLLSDFTELYNNRRKHSDLNSIVQEKLTGKASLNIELMRRAIYS